MSGSQYKIMTLDQPWGDSEETAVRIFPPCQVESTYHHGKDVIVWTVSTRGTLRRKRIDGYYGPYPTNGFVAWDDKNGEYAWHEVGSIDVPSAKDPDVPKFTPIIRGETETVVMGAGSPKRSSDLPRSRPRKGRFMKWWTSKSRANEIPDFLRKDA